MTLKQVPVKLMHEIVRDRTKNRNKVIIKERLFAYQYIRAALYGDP